jgi:hypothetical protein
MKDTRPNRLFSCHKYKKATKGMEENDRSSGESTGHVARMGEDRCAQGIGGEA